MLRVHLVTGAARGMGAAVARRFCAHGPVVLVDMDEERLDLVSTGLRETGADLRLVVGDLRDPSTSERIAETLSATGLPIGRVCHAAGLSPSMETWRAVIDVNVLGSVRLMAALEPILTEGSAVVLFASQAAHLVRFDRYPALDAILDDPLSPDFWDRLTSAGAGILDVPGATAYSWSKRAVRRLAVRYAPVIGPRGARIVSLSPGIIDTPMSQLEFQHEPRMAGMVQATPLEQRQGRADEVAAVVEFLCSPAASFVTGVDILVDGGSTEALAPAMLSAK